MKKYNILLDALPTSVQIDGTDYPIDTNFRTGIQFEMLLGNNTLKTEEKVIVALKMYYTEGIPRNVREAVNAITDFYRCGAEPKQHGETTAKSAIGRRRMDKIYDFDVDASLFYAAFLTQYGIDLNEVNYLHWWKFMAMFEGLNRDHESQRIMQIRATDLSTIENAKERQRIMRLQNRYRIDAGLSTEEKNTIAGSVFG